MRNHEVQEMVEKCIKEVVEQAEAFDMGSAYVRCAKGDVQFLAFPGEGFGVYNIEISFDRGSGEPTILFEKYEGKTKGNLERVAKYLETAKGNLVIR